MMLVMVMLVMMMMMMIMMMVIVMVMMLTCSVLKKASSTANAELSALNGSCSSYSIWQLLQFNENYIKNTAMLNTQSDNY